MINTNNRIEFITLENGDEYCIFDIESVKYAYTKPAKSEIYFDNYSTKSNFNLLELISKFQHFNIKLSYHRGYQLGYERKRTVLTKYTDFQVLISEEEREKLKKLVYRTNLMNRLINKSTFVSSENT